MRLFNRGSTWIVRVINEAMAKEIFVFGRGTDPSSEHIVHDKRNAANLSIRWVRV